MRHENGSGASPIVQIVIRQGSSPGSSVVRAPGARAILGAKRASSLDKGNPYSRKGLRPSGADPEYGCAGCRKLPRAGCNAPERPGAEHRDGRLPDHHRLEPPHRWQSAVPTLHYGSVLSRALLMIMALTCVVTSWTLSLTVLDVTARLVRLWLWWVRSLSECYVCAGGARWMRAGLRGRGRVGGVVAGCRR